MRTGAIRAFRQAGDEAAETSGGAAVAAFMISEAGAVVDGDLSSLARLQSSGIFQRSFRRLAPSDTADGANFSEACRSTARTARERGVPHARALRIGCPRLGEARVHLIAAPVFAGRETLLMAAVELTAPIADAFSDKAARMRRLFGLTSAEAQIAMALAAGVSPAQLAGQRASSVQTVRSQIKAAYAKLGVGRVGELCARVSEL